MSNENVWGDVLQKLKVKLREDAARRGHLDSKPMEDRQQTVFETPKHLARKPGESTFEQRDRIIEMAKNGDDEARAQLFMMRGIVESARDTIGIGMDGLPKPGYELTPEEEAANQRYLEEHP